MTRYPNIYDNEPLDNPTLYTSEDGSVTLALWNDVYTVYHAGKMIQTEDGLVPDAVDYKGSEPLSTFLDLPMLYSEDKQQRLEFDDPRAYRQRAATPDDDQEVVSVDGWIDEHDEIVSTEEGSTIDDLFWVQ